MKIQKSKLSKEARTKAVGELKLESGDLRGTDIVGAFGTLGADEHTVTRYDAYDGADHRSRDGGDGA